MLRSVQTDRAPAAVGPYSQAIIDEDTGLVFCAGQIGLEPVSGILVSGGVQAEFQRALKNVEAVLEAGGCGLGDVVRMVVYLADIDDFGSLNDLYLRAFSAPYPARSTIQAAALPKGARVELEVTAKRGG